MTSNSKHAQAVLDFSEYIDLRTINFTGREWVFDEIEKWLDKTDAPRFLILSGDPGIGKSAIAARLTQFSNGSKQPPKDYRHIRKDFISAYHFCFARNGGWIAPESFARSISTQLSLHYPAFAESIASSLKIEIIQMIEKNLGEAIALHISDYHAESSESIFNNLVRMPLNTFCKTHDLERPILMLIDGLDEALYYSGRPNIIGLLAACHDLSPQVRVLMTSRNKDEVLGPFRPSNPFILYAKSENNKKDVKEYLKNRIEGSAKLRQQLVDKPKADGVIDNLAERSAGNFLVVSKILDSIERSEFRFNEEETLPTELGELYAWFLDRLTKGDKSIWRELYRPALGILTVAFEPLDISTLSIWAGMNFEKINDSIHDLREFMEPVMDGKYRLYHQSVADFLSENHINPYFIEKSEYHRKIAEFYTKESSSDINWSDFNKYGLRELMEFGIGDLPRLTSNQMYALRYLPTHLREAQMWDELCEVLTDSDFLQAKLDALAVTPEQLIPLSTVFDLLRDFENALEALPNNHSKKEQVSIMLSIITAKQTTIIASELAIVGPFHGPSSSLKAVIVHIKDAFTSYEARKHMVSILERLINQYGLKLILVEGGSGNVSLSYLREYGTKETRIKVAEKYLKNFEIAPEEYLDIVSDYPLIIWGIEDDNLYEKHYQAFMETEKLRERLQPTLTSLRHSINLLKVRWQDSVMSDFEAKTDAYQKKDLSLADFTNFLINTATHHGIKTEEYPNLSRFLHEFQLERIIDFTRAELERNTFVRELAQRMSGAEIDGLLKRSKEFKAGKITELDYYIGLEKLALSAGIEIDLYSSFSSYFNYLKQGSQIHVPELVDELDRLVKRLRITLLAPTPQSKRLLSIDEQLQLIEKLLNHSLKPTDYQHLCGLSLNGIAQDWSTFLEEHLPTQCLSSEEIAQLKELEGRFPSCKDDYEAAHLREEAMIRNTLAKLDETKERIAVLIAGGFHSPRIVEGLKDHGVGVLEVTPKISQASDKELYLSVLKGKKRIKEFLKTELCDTPHNSQDQQG